MTQLLFLHAIKVYLQVSKISTIIFIHLPIYAWWTLLSLQIGPVHLSLKACLVLSSSIFFTETPIFDANPGQTPHSVTFDHLWSRFVLFDNVHLSLVTRKPVFGVCEQLRLTPACSADETDQGLEISIPSRGTCIILSRQWTTKALIRPHGRAVWSEPLSFAYGINRFSHDVAPFMC